MRAAGLVALIYMLIKLVWIAHPLIFICFLGVLFGLAVAWVTDYLERHRIPRGFGAPLTVTVVVGLFVASGMWMAPTLRVQSQDLRERLPLALDKLDAWLEARQGGFFGALMAGDPGVLDSTVKATDRARVAECAAGADSPAACAPASSTSGTVLRRRIVHQLMGAKRYLFPFLTSTLAFGGGITLALFIAVYVAFDPHLYHDGLMRLFPVKSRDRIGEVLTEMAISLRRWFVTQTVVMLVTGLLTTGLLLVLDVRAAVPLGILAGLFQFIPTVGAVVAAFPAIAMAFVDSPEKAFWVTLTYVVLHFIGGHVIIPILMQQGVNLPPALTLGVQALMTLLFGFMGLLIAVPLMAAVMVAVKMLYVEGMERAHATGLAPPGATTTAAAAGT